MPGKENPADVGTKSLDRRTLQRLLPLARLLDRKGSTTEATRGRTDMGNAKSVIAGVVTTAGDSFDFLGKDCASRVWDVAAVGARFCC